MPALWVSSSGGSSGIERASVDVTDDGKPGFTVDLAQATDSGAGPSWRAASAQAATMSALLSGLNPGELSYSFDVTGKIDGPSAGALLTVGALAALRGDALDPAVTMTGTISSDGGIGPVGGIDAKVQAAAREGFTTVLVPPGASAQAAAPPSGVSVIEVGDIADAYERFTGRRIAVASPAPMSPAVADAGIAQAQALAGVDDFGIAVTRAIEDAAIPGDQSPAALARQAEEIRVAADTLVDHATSPAAVESMPSGQLAAVPAVLALVLRAEALASGSAAWAAGHADDQAGLAASAQAISQQRAVVERIAPALLEVSSAVPGTATPSHARATEVLEDYSAFLNAATSANADYLTAVLDADATKFDDDVSLAPLAASVRSLREGAAAAMRASDLTAALQRTARELAAWSATAAAIDTLEEVAYGQTATGESLAAPLLSTMAAQAQATGEDPSWAQWVGSWAPGSGIDPTLMASAVAMTNVLATATTSGS